MDPKDIRKLRSLTNLPALVDYLRDEMDWPIEVEDADDITFSYDPTELGIDPKHAVKIDCIKQVRPLVDGQPWGVFYIEFESKRLPVVLLRRILRSLVPRSRGQDPDRPVWHGNDLLFISAQGEANFRSVSFAHFHQRKGRAAELRTFSWDARESHFFYLQNLNLEALHWPAPEVEANATAWQEQWGKAFTVEHRYVIKTSQMLAREMARQARTVREQVEDIYRLEAVRGPLHRLYDSFREVLLHDLTPEAFADMVAQTVAYGLFSAAAQSDELPTFEHMVETIPKTNPFLKDLLSELTTHGAVDLEELGVDQLVELLWQTDLDAIKREFGRQSGGGREDPVVHFYELFLREYDPEQKVRRGVFYTPDPVVSYIVRSVDRLLRNDFGLEDGLADISVDPKTDEPLVQILDPACGTGTFLAHVIDQVKATFEARGPAHFGCADWSEYVARHLLPRLFGFELMMAPYAVAHMKLGLKLQQTGYDFRSRERLRVYLTNSLEPPVSEDGQLSFAPSFLAHESQAASQIKGGSLITVVVGNPPYSNFSANLTPEARELVARYKTIDDHPITERNPLQLERNLNDDYIKFIACAEDLLSRTSIASFSFITNNSYLDAKTLRGVRAQILLTFDQIQILDLGGSTDLSGSVSSEIADENVFDISQGVAILLGCRVSQPSPRPSTVAYHRATGTRSAKYRLLSTSSSKDIEFRDVEVVAPDYLFVPTEYPEEWRDYLPIDQCFSVYAEGLKTGFDHGLIGFSEDEARRKTRVLGDLSTSVQVIREQHKIGDKGWAHDLLCNRTRTARRAADSHHFIRFPYRPMDFRYCAWPSKLLKAPSSVAGQHLARDGNVCLIAARQVAGPANVTHFYVSRLVPDNRIFYSRRGSATYFPLYRLEEEMALPNQGTCLTSEIRDQLTRQLGLHWIDTGSGDLRSSIGPEAFLHFCYAVFHSLAYRSMFNSALKHEFPRIPLVSNIRLFRRLCGLGANLAALHLLEDDYPAASWNQVGYSDTSPLSNSFTTFVLRTAGTTMGAFSKSRCYEHGRVYLDTSQPSRSSFFDGVPEDVWDFHIGGYQVLHKWLYDRRGTKGKPGRTLTGEDIEHYQRIVVALKETIRLMGEIDEVIEAHGGWPIE
ncbi:type ISP restriction/modification enzyme [Chloroflexota bacterium]